MSPKHALVQRNTALMNIMDSTQNVHCSVSESSFHLGMSFTRWKEVILTKDSARFKM